MIYMTTWLPIAGYEGFYEVSDDGQIRSLDRQILGPRGTFRIRRSQILSPALSTNGYLTIRLCRESVRSTKCVHRLVAEAFLGPCPEGLQVRHGPGGRTDNSVENLSYGTAVENIAERDQDGWGAARKMSPALIREMRALHASGVSYEELAIKYDISKPSVYRIARRLAWKNVD